MSSYLVVLIVDDPENVADVLRAWEGAGAPGVTIFNSTGLGRIRRAGLREDLPLMPSLRDLLETDEIQHRTLFAVVETEAQADRLAQAAQDVTGDLDDAHTGFLFIVPVLKTYGMGKGRTDRSRE